MSYQTEYRKWLESPALDDAQRAELAAIEGNEAEIDTYGPPPGASAPVSWAPSS